MAYIDFPSNPTLADEVTLAGTTYVWNGTGWTTKGSGGGAAPVDAYTKAESDANFVNVPGDTMTGSLNIFHPNPALTLNVDKATNPIGYGQLVGMTTAAVSAVRWSIKLIDEATEAGADSGSNFQIVRYRDDGLDVNAKTALSIDRASGNMTLNGQSLTIRDVYPLLYLDRLPSGNTQADRRLIGMTNGLSRWTIQLGDNAAEGGGNTGSDFRIAAHDDAGNQLGSMVINRSTAGVQVASLNSMTSVMAATGMYASAADWWVSGSGINVNAATGYKFTAGDWAGTSDARIKTVLGPYEHGLAEILQIDPVRFQFRGNSTVRSPNYIEGNELTADHQSIVGQEFVGLVAQDVEVAMPEMVTQVPGWIDNQPVTDLRVLDTTALTYALINAVKELTARIETLEGALAAR